MDKPVKEISVVTGASSGLGRAIAEKLAERGTHVVLSSRNESRLEKTARHIRERGGECTVIPTDITSESSVHQMVEKAEKLGEVDILVNNAGLGLFSRFAEHSTEIWDQQMSVNLRGAFLVTRGFLPGMQKRKKGTVVFINSVAGKWGYPFSAAYVASKFGLRGLAESLRNEVRQDNIKVISVHPGAIDSPFWDAVKAEFPREEMITTDEVAESVVQAVTIPGIAVVEELVIRRVQGDF